MLARSARGQEREGERLDGDREPGREAEPESTGDREAGSTVERDLLGLIDQLEDLVASTPRIPLTGKVILSEDDFYEIMDGIRAILPEDLKEARWIIKERDRVLEEAREESDAAVKRAQDQSEAIVRKAEQEADRLIRQAEQEAKRLVEGASQEADRLVRQAQREVEEVRRRSQEESERLVEEARAVAARLTDENAITAKAEREAKEILERAEQTAMAVHKQAREYAAEVLGKVELLLQRATGTVRQSKDELLAQIEVGGQETPQRPARAAAGRRDTV